MEVGVEEAKRGGWVNNSAVCQRNHAQHLAGKLPSCLLSV